MKARYKITVTAVLPFVVLDLPFFAYMTVINDAFFDTGPTPHYWSMPIHTKVSGLSYVYGTEERETCGIQSTEAFGVMRKTASAHLRIIRLASMHTCISTEKLQNMQELLWIGAVIMSFFVPQSHA